MILEGSKEEGSKMEGECCGAGKSSFFLRKSRFSLGRVAKVGKCGFGASLED